MGDDLLVAESRCPKCRASLTDGRAHGYDYFCRFCSQGFYDDEGKLAPVDIDTLGEPVATGPSPKGAALRVGVIMYQTSYSKGQELVAQRMVREFRRLGHKAYLITSTFHDSEPILSQEEIEKEGGYICTYDERFGIPVIRVSSEASTWPPRRVSFRDFMGVLPRIVSELNLNVLVTHSTLWNGPEETTKFVVWNRQMGLLGASGPPIVLCHMSHFQEADEERYAVKERAFREAWNRISLHEVLHHADLVLVTTPLEANKMKQLGADQKKLVLMPGGVDSEIFAGDNLGAQFRARHGLPASAKLVTFLGTVEERKNVVSILEVARILEAHEDLHFVIAGRLEGVSSDEVRVLAKGLPNVSLLGEIDDREKAQLIDETYLNITMSRSEALGIAQLEFMFRGVPVITSGVGGQSWIVRGGRNGVVLKGPDDVRGAADAIWFLIRKQKARDKLSKEARAFASKWTISSLVAELAERLSDRLADELSEPAPQDRLESTVEAKVTGGKKVVVTSERLMVSSAKTGKLIAEVPYNDLVKIGKFSIRHWKILFVGLGISLAMYGAEVMFPLQLAAAVGRIVALPQAGTSALLAFLLRVASPMVPFLASIGVFLATIKEGYMVQFGHARGIFLEKDFGRALGIASSLKDGHPPTPSPL